MNQKKKIKFNHNNPLIGVVLLTLVYVLGPNWVDPNDSVGQFFYLFMAVVAAFYFFE